jgi:DNA-binding transcriptional ArsR family regulator
VNITTSILGSKGKIKILQLLLREGEANITKIVRETGLKHSLVERHLEDLVRLGIVVERRVGRLRIFSLKLGDPRIAALAELIRRFEESS